MAIVPRLLPVPLDNPDGTRTSSSPPMVRRDTPLSPLRLSQQPTVSSVQEVLWGHSSSCGLASSLVDERISNSDRSSVCLVVRYSLGRIRWSMAVICSNMRCTNLPRQIKSNRMFQAGRFICGLGIGLLVTVCPMYLSEMSSAFHRGWLVGHHAIFLVFGYMLAGWVGFACYYAETTIPAFGWRFPLALQCLFPLILLCGSPWLPRSPRWLITKGKDDEAQSVLRKLRASSEDPNGLVAKEEFVQTKEQIRLEAERLANYGGSVWKAIFTRSSYRKRMAIGFLTQWGAEFGGPLIIVSFTYHGRFESPSLTGTRTTMLCSCTPTWA